MGVDSPDQMAAAFAERFNAGDAAGFAQLYAENAVFTYDGIEKAVGRRQIEGAISGFVMAGLKFKGECVAVHICGDTALTRIRWRLIDAMGAAVATGVSAEVQRRGADGKWRFIIDDAGGGSRT